MIPNGNGLWLRIFGALIPFVIAGLIGWGAMRSDHANLEAAVKSKANQETVAVQYRTLLDRLDAIDRRLERLEAR